MTEALSAIEVALAVRENLPAFRKTYQRTINFARLRRKPRIFTFGSPGTGKSTLSAVLSGTSLNLRSQSDYVASSLTEYYALTGEVLGSIQTVPGQPANVDTDWKDLAERVKVAQRPCLLFVVANGYHSLTSEINAQLSEKEKIVDSASFARFAKRMRARELDQFLTLVELLDQETRNLHILVVINKYDLWFSEREKVLQWYTGDFKKQAVEHLAAKFGKKRFELTFVPAAAICRNLDLKIGGDSNETIIKPVSLGFDHREFSRAQARLFDTINAALTALPNVKVI